jgi:hypothetical protein
MIGIPMNVLARVQQEFPYIRAFVETGTYHGETVDAVKDKFDLVMSVELSDKFYQRAVDLFAPCPHVKLYHGSSRAMLPKMLVDLGKQPAVFWLDAHYSCGDTALEGPGLNSPVSAEFDAIAAHVKETGAQHVIMIDDTIDFHGHVGFPPLHEAALAIANIYPNHSIRLFPLIKRGMLLAAPHWRD